MTEQEKKPDYEMYDEILPVFATYMRKELEANYLKGDREGPGGWLACNDNKYWVQDLYYHVGKLQAAVMAKDVERIKENTADIANLAMMMLDCNIDLLKMAPEPPVIIQCNHEWVLSAAGFEKCYHCGIYED